MEIRAIRASDEDQRRLSTAAKTVVGRDEIDRFGDTTLGDVLRRLPGVTLQGAPGQGGEIRLRGLGSGYTQILLDGQRVAPGFSIDSLAPEQIERIEILRAPTAETGARAIAGTINVVTREGFARRTNDLRLTAGTEHGRLQPHVAWTRNQPLGPFIVNTSLSAFRVDRDSNSETTTVGRALDGDARTLLAQHETTDGRDRRDGVHATGRLQWRNTGGVDSVTVMPLLLHSVGRSERGSRLTQTAGSRPPLYETADTEAENRVTLMRLNGQWNRRLEAGGRLEWTAGAGDARFVGSSRRDEAAAGVPVRRLNDDTRIVDRSLLLGGRFIRTLDNEHSLAFGIEGEVQRRRETRVTDDPALLGNFGDNVAASSTRVALYAQDEWNLTPQWAAQAGLRWEGITTRGDSGAFGSAEQGNRSGVWSPLLHAVWKPAPESRDQIRLSLTRSYRSPSLQSLIARPSINTREPAPGPNSPTQPDRVGNPTLRPEVATGVDLSAERYFKAGGLLSATLFHREMRDYLRSRTRLEDVVWSPGQPRYVSRPENIGDATTQGLELEAKFRLNDLIADAPGIELRANASAFRSKVGSVPGPDNGIDQQPGYTVSVGADYRVPGWPVTLGGNLQWTPADDTRISEEQRVFQGQKRVFDAYARWVVDPNLSVVFSVSNLAPRDYRSAASVDGIELASGVPFRETSSTVSGTSTQWQVRLELKL